MFDDYKKEVLNSYLNKKEKHELSQNLECPTPAKLRRECLTVLERRFLKTDRDIIREFFEIGNDVTDYAQSIRKFKDVDKFKPLINYLKRETRDTEDKNIKLLAWLVDFTPRPFEEWRLANKPVEPEITSDPPKDLPPGEEETEPGETVSPGPKKPWFKRNIKQTALSLMAATTLCGGTYMFAYNGSQGCMYWTGDRYKSVPCQEKVEGATVLALDSAKLFNFRKINVPETLTISSINNLWYTKITVDSAEFYTGSGFHPLFPEKRLKPVTPYILNKYVLNK